MRPNSLISTTIRFDLIILTHLLQHKTSLILQTGLWELTLTVQRISDLNLWVFQGQIYFKEDSLSFVNSNNILLLLVMIIIIFNISDQCKLNRHRKNRLFTPLTPRWKQTFTFEQRLFVKLHRMLPVSEVSSMPTEAANSGL